MSFIFEPNEKKIISFSDDSSVNTTKTDNEKISIYADVLKEKPFDWFYKIISYKPVTVTATEFKSKEFNDIYRNLPIDSKRYIHETLKFVRINITDPRRFTGYVDKALRQIIPNENPKDFLEKLKLKNRKLANKIITSDREFRAKKLLQSRPSSQLKNRINFYSSLFQFDLWGDPKKTEDDFDLEPFRKNKANILNQLSEYLSKSSAVFIPAFEEISKLPYFIDPLILKSIASKKINSSFAYDIGNKSHIRQIENERVKLVKEFNPYLLRDFNALDPIIELDSTKSIYIQGADFAAGIARMLLEEKGFFEIKTLFETIYYNGQRLTMEESISLDRKYPIL